MNPKENEYILSGFETAFINSKKISESYYTPQFLSNNHEQGKKVLASIENELKTCDEFIFSVAFITMSGLTPLLQVFDDLRNRGVKGKILTTDYLAFNDPKALELIESLDNIELKMYETFSSEIGFHTKGYVFRKGNTYSMILGSSNLTGNALTTNKEWNSKVIGTEDGEFVKKLLNEFEYLWTSKFSKKYCDFIDSYRERFEIAKKQKELAKKQEIVSIETYKLSPNSMQVDFTRNLNELVEAGEDRALLISATGTGKTYASAFAVREQNPKKVLFVVHREYIARQAMASYEKVIDSHKTFGLLSGTSKDYDADILFSTMSMMAKDSTLSRYKEDEFDIIIIDEVHRSGAESYQKIMSYFKPKLWLGMSASPERPDGFDVFELFDHNIACEIRLQQAMENDLLCPFHYFGITDLIVDGDSIGDETSKKDFNRLISDERVKHILSKIKYYGYSGDRVKGIVFCSGIPEAELLSEKFNENGYRTLSLSGKDSQEKREDAVDRLTSDVREDILDYIFTVDIFNEGVDIPEINQVVMLRPTESPIVFVQQLGRGLRKNDGKEYLVILDFIGTYQNNFMIPMALSGDRTYCKDTIRKYVIEGNRVIPGNSTVHFDEISKERIYESISKMSTKRKLLCDRYTSLKNKLGKIPCMCDFVEYGEIDPLAFVEYSSSYYNFLKLVEGEKIDKINRKGEKILELISVCFSNGQRPHELELIYELSKSGECSVKKLKENLESYGVKVDTPTINSIKNIMDKSFYNKALKEKYNDINLSKFKNDKFIIDKEFDDALKDENFRYWLEDIIEFGLNKFNNAFRPSVDKNGLALFQRYTRADVCRLLNWEKDESSTIYGYRTHGNTSLIFVTYNKDDDLTLTKYQDEFINEKRFSWMSRHNRKIDSQELLPIINSSNTDMIIPLFVNKVKTEEFYYFGTMKYVDAKQEYIHDDKNNKDVPIVNMLFDMDIPVREDFLDYISDSQLTKYLERNAG